MKGYCVDVRGFSAQKKQLVAETIDGLCGYTGFSVGLEDFERDRNLNYITNVNRIGKTIDFSLLLDDVNPEQTQFEVSFNDLMLEAEYNYVENGVEGFNEVVNSVTKGYCLNLKRFSLEDKLMAVKALSILLGSDFKLPLKPIPSTIGNISSTGKVTDDLIFSNKPPTYFQKPYLCSLHDVMKESGLEDTEGKNNRLEGYCVNVKGFSPEKKKLVADAIDDLCGWKGSRIKLEAIEEAEDINYITNVNLLGDISDYSLLRDDVNPEQLQYEITFEKLRTLHLGWDILEGTGQPDKNETKDLSASRAIAIFYSKEEEIKELKSKVESLEVKCKRLEDVITDREILSRDVLTESYLKADRINVLEKELTDHKKLSFTMTLVAIVCFPLAVLLF